MRNHQTKYKTINIEDNLYPARLREIPHPPKVLYVRGEIPIDSSNLLATSKPMIGIVGSRECTSYGKRVTEYIVRGLVRAGVVIVSGMARGIDTEAHVATLEAGGKTIAVVGSGVDESVVYPRQNVGLAREIERHGAVLSEFDPFAVSETYFFPQRNRVISGLSLGVVVIEAKERSGALITANFALEQNREVFAVPGSIFWDTSSGANNLLKQGAKCVSSAEEIFGELGLAIPDSGENNIKASSPAQQRILEILLKTRGEGVHTDKLTELSDLSSAEVSGILVMMELEEKVKNLGGGYYTLNL